MKTNKNKQNVNDVLHAFNVGIKLQGIPGDDFKEKDTWLLNKASELSKNKTESEGQFGDLLSELGIWRKRRLGETVYFQCPVVIGDDHFIIDFIIFSDTLQKWFACEIDGEYHKDPAQIEKDLTRDAKLLAAGFIPIRIKNEETNSPVKLGEYVLRYGADDLALLIADGGKHRGFNPPEEEILIDAEFSQDENENDEGEMTFKQMQEGE